MVVLDGCFAYKKVNKFLSLFREDIVMLACFSNSVFRLKHYVFWFALN